MGSQEHKTKVISNNLNPKWNASMQFSIQNVDTDTLCITVYDRDLFSPNGKTTVEFSEMCPCSSLYRMLTQTHCVILCMIGIFSHLMVRLQ